MSLLSGSLGHDCGCPGCGPIRDSTHTTDIPSRWTLQMLAQDGELGSDDGRWEVMEPHYTDPALAIPPLAQPVVIPRSCSQPLRHRSPRRTDDMGNSRMATSQCPKQAAYRLTSSISSPRSLAFSTTAQHEVFLEFGVFCAFLRVLSSCDRHLDCAEFGGIDAKMWCK